jgi:hypothetical protein
MTQIQQASFYKLIKLNKILIHSLSRIQMGGSIGSEPFIWLDGDTSLKEVVKQIIYALSMSKAGLPNPTDWKVSAKEFLKNIGLKKQSDLYKDCIHIDITIRESKMSFTPMKNLGSKGFVNVSKEKIEISENASIEEIVKALEEALSITE